MTYAFDLDGTINRYPAQLGTIMKALMASGQRVVVLTAVGPNETYENRLKMMAAVGIDQSFFHQMTLVPDDMGVSKGVFCRAQAVDVLIDDAPHNLSQTAKISPATMRLHLLP